MALHHRGCPIRKSAGQRLFPPHRGLSQVITSFIGSQCQGIHLTLFFAWTAFYSCSPILEISFSALIAWASQIIVILGCKLKDLCVLIHCCFVCPLGISTKMTKLLPNTCTEKPKLLFLNNKFFSIYNYLFVSYTYSVFNEHFANFVRLVGPSGLEPPTSCLSGTRSNLLSYEPMWLVWFLSHLNCFTNLRFVGGDDGIRFSRELRARSSAALTVV